MMHDPVACVRGAEIFHGLDDDVVKALAAISTHQRPVSKGTALYEQGTRHLQLPMSKRDLASWLSVTPETLSRQFTKLTAAGVLTTSGQKVTLH